MLSLTSAFISSIFDFRETILFVKMASFFKKLSLRDRTDSPFDFSLGWFGGRGVVNTNDCSPLSFTSYSIVVFDVVFKPGLLDSRLVEEWLALWVNVVGLRPCALEADCGVSTSESSIFVFTMISM